MSKEQELQVMMKRLNNLANSANKAKDKGMKQIWSDKWHTLVKTYAQKIQKDQTFKERVKENERLND